MNFAVFLSSWGPVAVWAGLIYYLSDIPSLNSGLGVWDFFLRKGAHVFEFAVLTALLLRASRRTWSTLTRMGVVLFSGFIAVLYAVSDEYHQSFVPGRGPSAVDVLVDSVGISLAAYVYVRHSRESGNPGRKHVS